MYQLNIQLKQHTPLIHFQHTQDGATLRATEVKPKLDRFLIEQHFGGILKFDDYKPYLIGDVVSLEKEWKTKQTEKDKTEWLYGQKLAFDYKMRISCRGNIFTDEIVIIPPNKERTVFYENTTLTILIYNKFLLKILEDNINPFLVNTSFSKRSSKGFGCYYPDKMTWEEVKNILPKNTFVKLNVVDKNVKRSYQYISRLNRIIKSGVNFNGYIKSKLFVYLVNKKIRWDKRWIKKELKNLIDTSELPYNLKVKHNKNEPNDWYKNLDIKTDNRYGSNNTWEDAPEFEKNYVFARALLGLSEHWEFLTTNDNYKYKVIPEEPTEEIERFKSPIIFKVFDRNLFILTEKIPSVLYNKAFQFKVQIKKKDGRDWKDDGEPIYFQFNDVRQTLKTPTNFDVNDFLNECLPAENLNFTKI